jgi:glycosyltransferase involved in cell wall biosynthesis
MRTVLHVLPHPGGGGETYVDTLASMEGYRFERLFVAPTPGPAGALRSLPRTELRVARDADLIHVQGEIAAAICLPALAARRSVVTFNGLHLLRRTSGMALRAAKVNLRLVVAAATRTICVSEAERHDVLEAIGPGADARLVVIHNGAEVPSLPAPGEREAARAELGLAETAVAGVFLGALDPHKEPLTAARAAAQAARDDGRLVLLVAGDGPLRPELESFAAASGCVRVLGHRRDVARVLAAADFFVLPSLREGLSFSLLEAMALALPPVVSDAPGNPEAVGDAGIVVARGDVAGFAEAFGRLLASEADRRSLGERARERVAAGFGAEKMVRETRELYERILQDA